MNWLHNFDEKLYSLVPINGPCEGLRSKLKTTAAVFEFHTNGANAPFSPPKFSLRSNLRRGWEHSLLTRSVPASLVALSKPSVLNNFQHGKLPFSDPFTVQIPQSNMFSQPCLKAGLPKTLRRGWDLNPRCRDAARQISSLVRSTRLRHPSNR